MEAGLEPLPEGQVEREDSNTKGIKQGLQLPYARLVAPRPPPNDKRVLVKPNTIPSLDLAGRFDRTEDRDILGFIKGAMQSGLARALRFSHAEKNGAILGYQRWVMGEHGIC
jgi:hypothetical protein